MTRSREDLETARADVPVVPGPPLAECARTLLHVARDGVLSTHSQKMSGFPFGSVAPYGLDPQGRPTFLLSTLALHTRNLAADRRASLLVRQSKNGADPLSVARVTLIGHVDPIPEADVEMVPLRENYLERHPTARRWVDFGDFGFFRMELQGLYFVAGFGAMGWLDAASYAQASADPLADSVQGIVEHMNQDHADALLLYCDVFARVPAEQATMTAVDRMGMRISATAGGRAHDLRINFPAAVHTPVEVRKVLIEMLRQARAD